MRIVYYALKPLQVGGELRQPGDLIPEAKDWAYVSGYVTDGRIAPVLVATLPEAVQKNLLEWEKEREGRVEEGATVNENDETGGVKTSDETDKPETTKARSVKEKTDG